MPLKLKDINRSDDNRSDEDDLFENMEDNNNIYSFIYQPLSATWK